MKPNLRTEADFPTELSDRDLAVFQRLARSASGIELSASKRPMIYTRFARRLKALELNSFSDYLELVSKPGAREYEYFVNTLTTNLSYFFRETPHFQFLRDTVIPDVFSNRIDLSPARIWSAGCSYGAEPYTIAMVLCESSKIGGADYRLLCTDIDSAMVSDTESGRFSLSKARGLTQDQITHWFTRENNGIIKAKPALQSGMICKKLNLFDDWPIKPGVDVIFCRNVLIYFDRNAQRSVIDSFAAIQNRGHYLFLGHSESIRGFETKYVQVSNTVYRRL